jgi:hypothetical protein
MKCSEHTSDAGLIIEGCEGEGDIHGDGCERVCHVPRKLVATSYVERVNGVNDWGSSIHSHVEASRAHSTRSSPPPKVGFHQEDGDGVQLPDSHCAQEGP